MRTYPEDQSEHKEAAQLGAEPWMLDLLKLNPKYVFWGPGEDYMKASDPNGGWSSGMEYATWKDVDLGLDDLNECVNFYFQITRASEQCDACEGEGVNPETLEISRTFYCHHLMRPEDRKRLAWHDKITQDEVDALWEEGRLRFDTKTKPTAEEVNARQHLRGFMSHDAINRWILIKARAQRLGVYGECEKCGGHGHIFTEPSAHASLVLWILHPRKGASRGVEVKHLNEDDLPSIRKFLGEAADRNAMRFAKVLKAAGKEAV